MDLREWIQGQHSGIQFIFRGSIIPGLSEAQLAEKPAADANSIVWLMWHCARTEDVAVNTVVRGAEQVLARDGWSAKLGIERSEIGTGMSDDEAAEFTRTVNGTALAEYWSAVQQETRSWLDVVLPEALDEKPDVKARLAAAPPTFVPAGSWAEGLWTGRPASFFIGWVAIGHTYLHLGEMTTTRSRLGVRGL